MIIPMGFYVRFSHTSQFKHEFERIQPSLERTSKDFLIHASAGIVKSQFRTMQLAKTQPTNIA